jgi:type IV pilus assembly protein PilF
MWLAACASTSHTQTMSATDKARLLIEYSNGAILDHDPITALGTLFQAEKLDPLLPELHHSKALAYYAKKDMVNAEKSAEKAIELKPDYSDALNTLGRIYIDLGKNKQAEAVLLQAIKNPLYREAYKSQTNLGILYYRTERLEAANKVLNEAVEGEPNLSCVAHYYLGHIQLMQQSLDKAIKSYEKASQKYCGAFAEAHLALGVAYERTKDFGRARKKLVEVQQLYPDTKVGEEAIQHLRALP